jgi:hypothetical protein
VGRRLKIVDGNNSFRRVLEKDPTGLTPRKIVQDLATSDVQEIWVWDGFNANARRREIYPEYKANRVKAGENIYAAMKFFKSVLADTNAIQIEVPGYEGDDVIAHIVQKTPNLGHVHIESTDVDLIAVTSPTVTIDASSKIPRRWIRLYKTAVGDSSDNIPGIKGFGPGAWAGVNKEALEAAIVKGAPFPDSPSVRKKSIDWFEENRELVVNFWTIVGFMPIPDDLVAKHIKVGTGQFDKALAQLKEFFL